MQQFGWIGHDKELLYKANQQAPFSAQWQLKVQGNLTTRRMALFQIARKVLGKDIDNIPQPTGCCVGASTKRIVEYLQCVQISLGNLSDFKYIFAPYHYGCGRVFIGGQKGSHQDGSIGIWQAQALQKYGVICLDDPGVPPYDKDAAVSWGADDGNILEKFTSLGQKHLVKNYAKVSTVDQAVQAIVNGYPVEICSDQGFSMTPDKTGFHQPEGTWNHSMSLIYCDDDGGGIPSHFGILNNWGDSPSVHGILQDLRDPTLTWAGGMLRVHSDVVGQMLAQDDSWAYSSFDDFPIQVLPDFSMF